MQPNQIDSFNIADWLAASNGEKFSEGSLEIFFHGPGMGIGGQLVITDERHGTSFDVPFTEGMEFSSSRLDSLWWSLDDKTQAEVFLANTKSSQIIVTPTFYVGGSGIESEPIVLEAHESKTLDIGQALRKLRAKQEAAGGISLRQTGQPGSLAVTGVVTNKARGFSSTLRFIDATMQRSSSLHGAHLLIGQPAAQSGLPLKSKFVPRAIVRNTTDLALEVYATVRYKLDNVASSIQLPPLALNAFEVRELDLSEVISSVGTRIITDAGIELQHNGKPGWVLAAAASIDQSGNHVFDVPIKDPMAKKGAGGSHPWRIEGDERAVLHLKNIDPQGEASMRQAVVVLYYEGGSYTLPVQQVEAGQTFEMDIKKLRDEQIPDGFGNLIPAGVERGQVRWFGRGELGQFIGRIVQYNPAVGTSSSFSCPTPCPCEPSYDHGEIQGGPIQGAPGERFFVTLVDAVKDCNGFITRYPVQDLGASVTSSSPLTASVSGPVSDPFGGMAWQVTLGSQAGTATIRGSWTAVKWRSTCIGSSFASNCSEFRCTFSYAVGSASTTATIRTPRIQSISLNRALIGTTVNVTIVGEGFGSNANVQVGGTGITVTIDFRSPTEIGASFAIAPSAQPGNQAVSVRVGTQISNSVNFFVQVPTRLRRDIISGLTDQPGGCGVTRTLQYTLLDQAGQPIISDDLLKETISNFTGPENVRPPTETDIQMSNGIANDVVGYTIPSCPPPFTATFTQTFRVVVGAQSHSLTTANSMSMGRTVSGTKFVDITITTE